MRCTNNAPYKKVDGSDKAFYAPLFLKVIMKKDTEQQLFAKADHDPAQKDARDALRLIEYLEERNAKLHELEEQEEKTTFGQRVADAVAAVGGSWGFIITFVFILAAWVLLNLSAFFGAWDPFPFILLNLCLSTIAALQAPIILMSQNRQAERDRLRTWIDLERDRLDLEVDTFAAKVTRDAFLKLHEIDARLQRIEKKLEKKR
jgi:uncharacterized membrane protein